MGRGEGIAVRGAPLASRDARLVASVVSAKAVMPVPDTSSLVSPVGRAGSVSESPLSEAMTATSFCGRLFEGLKGKPLKFLVPDTSSRVRVDGNVGEIGDARESEEACQRASARCTHSQSHSVVR